MHFGILAADVSWQALRAALERHTGEFIDRGPVPDFSALDGASDEEGFILVAGEHAGKAYLLDTSWILSGAEPDLIAQLAAELKTLVVGCGAETVSGSYFTTVARGDTLLRLYHHCHTDLFQPYDRGEPFPSEAHHPLEDLDGMGFRVLLRDLGFDEEGWREAGEKRLVFYTAERGLESLATGPLSEALAEHRREFEIPEGRRPQPQVLVRRARPEGATSEGGSWLGRLFRRFRG